jgi:hypothetical protein
MYTCTELYTGAIQITPGTASLVFKPFIVGLFFRLDVLNLQEQLDLKLVQRQARETGICQVCRSS